MTYLQGERSCRRADSVRWNMTSVECSFSIPSCLEFLGKQRGELLAPLRRHQDVHPRLLALEPGICFLPATSSTRILNPRFPRFVSISPALELAQSTPIKRKTRLALARFEEIFLRFIHYKLTPVTAACTSTMWFLGGPVCAIFLRCGYAHHSQRCDGDEASNPARCRPHAEPIHHSHSTYCTHCTRVLIEKKNPKKTKHTSYIYTDFMFACSSPFPRPLS